MICEEIGTKIQEKAWLGRKDDPLGIVQEVIIWLAWQIE